MDPPAKSGICNKKKGSLPFFRAECKCGRARQSSGNEIISCQTEGGQNGNTAHEIEIVWPLKCGTRIACLSEKVRESFFLLYHHGAYVDVE